MPIFNILPNPDIFKKIWNSSGETSKFKLVKNGLPAWYEASVIHLQEETRGNLGRVIVIHDITQEHALLEIELRRSAQLGLLEEVGRQIADSFEAKEILQRSIDLAVNRFGYAEAAVSIPAGDKMMEVIAIAGTQRFWLLSRLQTGNWKRDHRSYRRNSQNLYCKKRGEGSLLFLKRQSPWLCNLHPVLTTGNCSGFYM